MGLRSNVGDRGEPRGPGALAAGLATLAALACVAGLAGAAALTGVPFSTVSRDPATALGGPFVTGYLSYLGACLWCAAAAVALFSSAVTRHNDRGAGDKSRFLLHAGLFTALLGADDLFMLHDGLVPYLIADIEHAMLTLYGLTLLALLVVHRGVVRRTNPYLFAAALGCFAAASLVDMGLIRPGEARRHLFEDGLKFVGIANWSAWMILASLAAVRVSPGLRVMSTGDAGMPLVRSSLTRPMQRPWPTRVGLLLGGIGLLITAAGAVGQWLRHARGVERSFGFIHQFAPDDEANLASWYASAVMLLCVALLGSLALREATAWKRRRWWGLAALFTAMSADEVAQVHEMSIGPLREWMGARGALYFTWVVPGFVFAAIVAAVSLRFLRHLPPRTCWLFLSAGATYLAGALGVEMSGGWYAETHGVDAVGYAFLSVAEEALELGGLVLFAYALCDYVSRNRSDGNGSLPPRQFAAAAGDGDFRGS